VIKPEIKNEIYACYIVYNEADKIAISLNSILPYVDKVIMVDGAFKSYPHDNPQSTDGTKAVAEKICGDKLIWIDCSKAWISEGTKRNEYLKYIPEGAWFYILDADTIWFGDIKSLSDKIRINDTIDGNYIGWVKLLNFYPILTENPYKLTAIKVLNENDKFIPEYRDLTKNKKDWYENLVEVRKGKGPVSYVNWIGFYYYVWGVYRKVNGMEYNDKYHSKLFVGDIELIEKIHAIPPVGQKWDFIPNILAINMKFLNTFDRYFSNQDFKAITHRMERTE
jgi:hypothetical protein